MSQSNNNAFVMNSNLAAPYNFKCHYYKDSAEAISLVKELMEVVTVEKLHTYHPECHLQAATQEIRETLKKDYGTVLPLLDYGIWRMSAVEFFARPSMTNTVSCHGLNSGEIHPGGNANYLANASWACYGMYRHDAKNHIALDDSLPHFGNKLEGRQPVATVNVLFGYNSEGFPTAMLSRVYGDSSLSWNRLVTYLHGLGMQVSYHDRYNGTNRDGFQIANQQDMFSIPAIAQIRTSHYGLELVSRYGDIDYAKKVKIGESQFLMEDHNIQTIASRTDCSTATVGHKLTIADNLKLHWHWNEYGHGYDGYSTYPKYVQNNNMDINPQHPRQARPLLSYLKDLHNNATEVSTANAWQDQSICSDCGNHVCEDDLTYVAGELLCESCLSESWVYSDSVGEYLPQDEATYSECQEDYISDNDAIEFITATNIVCGTVQVADTDNVQSRRMSRYNVVELDVVPDSVYTEYANYDICDNVSYYKDGEISEGWLLVDHITNAFELQQDAEDNDVYVACDELAEFTKSQLEVVA